MKSVITVRLAADEHRFLKEAAFEAGKTLNQFCVDALLEAARRELVAAEKGKV